MTRRQGPAGPSETIELDHTACDPVVVCDRTGMPICRPTIAVAFDRYRQMPYGVYIGFDTQNVHPQPPSAGGAA